MKKSSIVNGEAIKKDFRVKSLAEYDMVFLLERLRNCFMTYHTIVYVQIRMSMKDLELINEEIQAIHDAILYKDSYKTITENMKEKPSQHHCIDENGHCNMGCC